MRKESYEALLQAYDEMCEKLGLNLKQGMKQVCDAMEGHLRKLRPIRSRPALEAMLMREPEPSPSQLTAHIDAVRILPYQLRKALPEATKEVAQQIPHAPGGRPRRFTLDESREICSQVGALLGKGVKLRAAQQRIAQQKGVGLRTIQRTWQNNKKAASMLEGFDSAN